MSIKVLDKGSVNLVQVMGCDMDIVRAARVSYDGDSKGDEKDKKLLNFLMRNHHVSPFEMATLKFEIKTPIFVARQFFRHRTASANEVSARYTKVCNEFYIPEAWRKNQSSNKQVSDDADWDPEVSKQMDSLYKNTCDMALHSYETMLSVGVAREQARMCLPQSMYTKFIFQMNLRNLLHFLNLRMDSHAQYEIRVYAEAMGDMVKELFPWTWEAWMKYR